MNNVSSLGGEWQFSRPTGHGRKTVEAMVESNHEDTVTISVPKFGRTPLQVEVTVDGNRLSGHYQLGQNEKSEKAEKPPVPPVAQGNVRGIVLENGSWKLTPDGFNNQEEWLLTRRT